ncbi:MAG: hypothetical protein R3E87_26380 [Burkholderiaceae bacterium]
MRTKHVVGAAVLAAVCSAATAAEPTIHDFFWPEHHETLTYKVRSHGLNGNLWLTLGETVDIDGKRYREVKTSAKGYPGKRETIYLRADGDAIYARYSKAADAPEVVELKSPIAPGTKWQTVDRDGKPSERTITQIGPCKTREGLAFETCVRVDYRWQELAAVSFYTPIEGEVIFSGANGFFNRRVVHP